MRPGAVSDHVFPVPGNFSSSSQLRNCIGLWCFRGIRIGGPRYASGDPDSRFGNEHGRHGGVRCCPGHLGCLSIQAGFGNAQRWDMSLSELTHPVPAESLLPMFDAMVDRALSRSENNTPATENHQPHPPVETPARLLDLSTPKRAGRFVSQALAPLHRKA